MKISNSWLQDYLKVDLSIDEISDLLTDIGLEVEGVHKYETIKGGLEGIYKRLVYSFLRGGSGTRNSQKALPK